MNVKYRHTPDVFLAVTVPKVVELIIISKRTVLEGKSASGILISHPGLRNIYWPWGIIISSESESFIQIGYHVRSYYNL